MRPPRDRTQDLWSQLYVKHMPLFSAMSNFNDFCTKISLKEQSFRKKQKVNFELLTQLVPFDVLSHICPKSCDTNAVKISAPIKNNLFSMFVKHLVTKIS